MGCFKNGKLEIPCKNAAACIESADFKLYPALLWKRACVMLFNATLAEEFARTLDTDWKPLILRRGEEIGGACQRSRKLSERDNSLLVERCTSISKLDWGCV